ncbi:MAG: hypothetical protein HN576_04960 [Bacteriovoracaceae bacterium]|jgi:hypothetical protein|nr:hypothetical protein [Bacteriovoracaceae bacterium]
MKRFKLIILIFLLPLMRAFSSDTLDVDIHGNIWAKFTQRLDSNLTPKSGFDIYRGFFIVNSKFKENWSGNLIADYKTTTPKLNSIDSQNGGSTAGLFRAYIQGTSILSKNDTVRFGLQPNHFLGELYKRFGTRWIAKMNVEEEGFLASHQAGVSYQYSGKKIKVGYQIHNSAATHSKNTSNGFGNALTVNYMLTEKVGLIFNDEFSTTVRQNVASLGLYLDSECLKVLITATNRKIKGLDGESGYGLKIKTKLSNKIGFFTRVLGGNNEYKTNLGSKYVVTLGPTYSIAKKLNTALVYEKRKALGTAKDEDTLSLAFAGNF